MEDLIEALQNELNHLKIQLTFIDKLEEKSQGGFEKKYLVLKFNKLKLKIDACKNHNRPHLHVDYGTNFHAVSIAIDSCEILAGTIPNKYLSKILSWINNNKTILKKIWMALMEGKNPDSFLLELESL